MDLIDRLRVLSSQIPKQLEHIKTEESTKTALVMPFITALGYNVFDPTEVTPELTADVGIKKGEKVDYAIMKDGKPVILFECKWQGCDISKEHASQLYRYFSVTAAKFGVLTNGLTYLFFSDTDELNKMDAKPFFEFNILDIKESAVEELKKLSKTSFNADEMFNTAIDLKYTSEIKKLMSNEMENPSDEFVKFFAGKIYSGRMYQATLQKFSDIVKRSLAQFINDKISERLQFAIEQEKHTKTPQTLGQEQKPIESTIQIPEKGKINTLDDEVEGYYIIKSILRETIDPNRITLKDTAIDYCNIVIDDTAYKTICRLYMHSVAKAIGFYDNTDKKWKKTQLSNLYDIYSYADKLKEIAKSYEKEPKESVKKTEISDTKEKIDHVNKPSLKDKLHSPDLPAPV